MTQLLDTETGARILLDSGRERARISAERFVRRTYTRPAQTTQADMLRVMDFVPLATPLVLFMTEIETNTWGDDLIIEIEYGDQGQCTRLGGHFDWDVDQPSGAWIWTVYMD